MDSDLGGLCASARGCRRARALPQRTSRCPPRRSCWSSSSSSSARSGADSRVCVAALSSAAWFDFFLTKPYETFNITYRPDLQTEISLLVVGLAVTEIAARSRGHREDASEEARNVALIHDFTGMVASGEPPEFVIARAAAELTTLLGLKDCRFETAMSEGHPTRIEHFGVVTLGGLRWGAHTTGLPGREVELIVRYRGDTFGRFVMAPTPGAPVSSDRLLVAVFIADQVGAALADRKTSA